MEKKNRKKIAEFYDAYAQKQKATGINLRMYSLYKRMLRLGLHTGDEVLELGSGIGSITRLLAQKVKKGKIESVDISSSSVQWAKSQIKETQVRIYCGDIADYHPVFTMVPKWVTLFDVIEHIPLKRHKALFKQIDSYLPAKGKVLINIPSPEHIEHDRQDNPDILQIIDQPIYLKELQENLKDTDLKVTYFEVYDLWHPGDYNFIVLEKKRLFKENTLSFSWKRKLQHLKLKWLNLRL